jgi:DNA-binding transcriptional MerR regulator
MERKRVKIGEAAALIGSTPATLRKWEAPGELLPARKTKGGTRYYAVADLLALGDVTEKIVLTKRRAAIPPRS